MKCPLCNRYNNGKVRKCYFCGANLLFTLYLK